MARCGHGLVGCRVSGGGARRFGFRLGRFLKVGRRTAYPLSITRAERTSAGRCVIVGNAAQGLHPVAGMGFNLGLRDAASLAELIAEHRHEALFDAGAANLLAEYDAWRAADRGGVIAFTDGLVRLFANPLSVVRRLRNLGLLAFDLMPPAKAALSPLSTGSSRRACRSWRAASRCNERHRSRDFDVVIVGAGVIGAVMASLLLARSLSSAGRVALSRIASGIPAAPRRTPIGICGYLP